MFALSACGGGSTPSVNTPSVSAPFSAPAVPIYTQSIVLGHFTPEAIKFVDGQPGNQLAIDVPVASPLLSPGRNPLIASYRDAATPGAVVGCVSAPTSSTGAVDNINLGVNVRSVAALLDGDWGLVADAQSAFSGLAGVHFDNWENCGEKPEGRASLASRLAVLADGGYAEDVYDGNFGTNLNVISVRYNAAQVAAMLTSDGWLSPGTGNGAKRIWLGIYKHASGATLMLQQGWPATGKAESGFLAVYFPR